MNEMRFSEKNTPEVSNTAEEKARSRSPEEYERHPVSQMPNYENLQEEIDTSSFTISTKRLQEIYNNICKGDQKFTNQVQINEKSVVLLNKIYLAMMYRIENCVTSFPFDWTQKQYEHVKIPEMLNPAMSEIKTMHQRLKEKYDKDFEKASNEIYKKNDCKAEDIYEIVKYANKAKHPLDLNSGLVEAYQEFYEQLDKFRNHLHTLEFDQVLVALGQGIETKVMDQANKYKKGGMTKPIIDRYNQLFCEFDVEPLASASDKLKVFDSLSQAGIIKVDKKNCWRVTMVPRFPGNANPYQEVYPFKCAVDPVTGTIILDHVDRELVQQWRDHHFPKNFTNESWLTFLKQDAGLKREVGIAYFNESLDSQKDLPDEHALDTWLRFIEHKPESQKEPYLQCIKKLLERKENFLEDPPTEPSFRYLLKHLEIDEEKPWFRYVKSCSKEFSKELSLEAWHEYTQKFAVLKDSFQEEHSDSAWLASSNKHLDLLKEACSQIMKKHLAIPEEFKTLGDNINDERIAKYIEDMLERQIDGTKKVLELQDKLREKVSKETLSACMEKSLTLTDAFLPEAPQEAWQKFLKENHLEYDTLPKEFFEALHISHLIDLAYQEVKTVAQSETHQSATFNRMVVVNIYNSFTVELAHGLGKPEHPPEIFTREKNPKEFYRLLPSPFARQMLFSEKEISSIGVYRTACSDLALIFTLGKQEKPNIQPSA